MTGIVRASADALDETLLEAVRSRRVHPLPDPRFTVRLELGGEAVLDDHRAPLVRRSEDPVDEVARSKIVDVVSSR
jgi:hypothetical protein